MCTIATPRPRPRGKAQHSQQLENRLIVSGFARTSQAALNQPVDRGPDQYVDVSSARCRSGAATKSRIEAPPCDACSQYASPAGARTAPARYTASGACSCRCTSRSTRPGSAVDASSRRRFYRSAVVCQAAALQRAAFRRAGSEEQRLRNGTAKKLRNAADVVVSVDERASSTGLCVCAPVRCGERQSVRAGATALGFSDLWPAARPRLG